MSQVNQIIYDYLKNHPAALPLEIKNWLLSTHNIRVENRDVIRGCVKRFRENSKVSSRYSIPSTISLPPSKIAPKPPPTNNGESGLCLSDLRNFWNAVQQIGGRKIAKELLEMSGE